MMPNWRDGKKKRASQAELIRRQEEDLAQRRREREEHEARARVLAEKRCSRSGCRAPKKEAANKEPRIPAARVTPAPKMQQTKRRRIIGCPAESAKKPLLHPKPLPMKKLRAPPIWATAAAKPKRKPLPFAP
jgi:translation initiation factor IF-2